MMHSTKYMYSGLKIGKPILERWLRGVALFSIFLVVTSSAWAICEAERQSNIDAGVADQKKVCGRHWNVERSCIESETVAQFVRLTAETFDYAKNLTGDERRKVLNQTILELKAYREGLAKVPGDLKLNLYAANRAYAVCVINGTVGQNSGDATKSQNNAQVNSSIALDHQNQQTQQSQESQQAAQQNQSRADQQRQGKRKTNDPAAQAHECIEIDKAGSGNFGVFKNTCSFKVNFSTCNYKPRTIQGGFNWSADFDCEKNQFGLHTPDAGRSVAAHNRNTEMVYWFACKAPATPVDAVFVVGKGIEARCHN